VGLIGHTKSDAIETIAQVIEDKSNWWQPTSPSEESITELLTSRDIDFVGWPEWLRIDAEEKRLGEAQERERIKLVEREDFLTVAKKK
jgi:ferredoxin--NADP+ reductase